MLVNQVGFLPVVLGCKLWAKANSQVLDLVVVFLCLFFLMCFFAYGRRIPPNRSRRQAVAQGYSTGMRLGCGVVMCMCVDVLCCSTKTYSPHLSLPTERGVGHSTGQGPGWSRGMVCGCYVLLWLNAVSSPHPYPAPSLCTRLSAPRRSASDHRDVDTL